MIAQVVVASLGFSGPMVHRAPTRSSPVMAEMSKSIPFMKAPPALDGSMPGDVGFDPLGFSTTFTELGGDLNYVRESEITHGRVAMLAAAGFIVPEFFHLPGDVYGTVSSRALEAQAQVPAAAWAQIAISIAISEGIRSQNVYKPNHTPGDHGFDPLGFKGKFCKTDADYKTMQLKEIKNGRLAMLAVSGMFAQQLVTGKGPIEQLF
mmetsp:Transcript_29042/g.85146  ORF Transcript_29042/g.85146 Transcript_29042/m.85146 type:complete len:207 (+) Transcript_29042:55-675(+)